MGKQSNPSMEPLQDGGGADLLIAHCLPSLKAVLGSGNGWMVQCTVLQRAARTASSPRQPGCVGILIIDIEDATDNIFQKLQGKSLELLLPQTAPRKTSPGEEKNCEQFGEKTMLRSYLYFY